MRSRLRVPDLLAHGAGHRGQRGAAGKGRGRRKESGETPALGASLRFSSGEVHSLGMVMLELLTGLAPATADPTRPVASIAEGRLLRQSQARRHRLPGGRCHFVAAFLRSRVCRSSARY